MVSEGKTRPADGSAAPPAVRWLEVGEEEAGQRIDNFLLARLKGVPKSRIYRILRSGEVRVNSGRIEPAYRVQAGDKIRIPPVRVAERAEKAPAPPRELPILYEDEALLAVDKPSGLAVHGGSGIAHGVIESLRAARPQARFLELVHRLDRETSGVLLIAKKRSALTALHADLRERTIDKRYLAAVSGRFRNEKQRVRVALERREGSAAGRKVAVSEDGQPSETLLQRVAVGAEYTLLEAQLLTGRMHQIRVHLAHIKHPILGDDRYGNFELNRKLRKEGLKRMFLHAARLSLRHPLTGQALELAAPLPEDLDAFWKRHGV